MRIEAPPSWATSTVLWEQSVGSPKLAIIAKITFTFEGRVTEAAPEQQVPVFEGDQLRGSKESGEYLFESDKVPFKPKADVVLTGRAHAFGPKPVTKMEVGLKVGRLTRNLRVIGDRKWWFPTKMALVPSPGEPEAFKTMDLVYERAFGGIDAASAHWYPENPTGRGFIGKRSREAAHEKPLPNIEDPADPVTSWDSRPKKPAGFGFYGRGWMPRRAHAGTYDEKYMKERHPKLPLDFSLAFFNAAHPDLQVEGYLKGDEEVELRGVTPEGIVRFKLPGLRPKITVARWAADPGEWLDQQAAAGVAATLDDVPVKEEPAQPVLDTLVFLPEERLFYEVFRAVVPLSSLESLEIARIRIET